MKQINNLEVKRKIKIVNNYINNFKYDLAIKLLKKIQLKFPDSEDIYISLGRALDQKAVNKNHGNKKLFIEAMDNFKKSLKINPLSANALLGMGTVCLHQDKTEIALKYYLRVYKKLTNRKDKLIPINSVANCYRRLKNYKKAQIYYEKVIKWKSNFYLGYYNLAILFYYDFKKKLKAKEYAAKGIKLLNKEKKTKLLNKFKDNLKIILEN